MTETSPVHPFDQMLQAYLRWGEPVSGAFSRALLDRAGLAPNLTVLDSCTGAGALAVAAAVDGHTVHGIDTAPGMLRILADRLEPYSGSEAIEMDALAMTYEDETFDASFSVLGVTNFDAGLPPALAELVRVTRPGGTIGLSHWASTWGAPLFPIMAAAMERLDDPAVEPLVPVVSTDYITPADLDAALSGAGCVDVSTTRFAYPMPLPEPEQAFDELNTMFVLHPLFQKLDEKDRDRLRATFAEEVRKVRTADGNGPEAVCHLTIGRVPEHSPTR